MSPEKIIAFSGLNNYNFMSIERFANALLLTLTDCLLPENIRFIWKILGSSWAARQYNEIEKVRKTYTDRDRYIYFYYSRAGRCKEFMQLAIILMSHFRHCELANIHFSQLESFDHTFGIFYTDEVKAYLNSCGTGTIAIEYLNKVFGDSAIVFDPWLGINVFANQTSSDYMSKFEELFLNDREAIDNMLFEPSLVRTIMLGNALNCDANDTVLQLLLSKLEQAYQDPRTPSTIPFSISHSPELLFRRAMGFCFAAETDWRKSIEQDWFQTYPQFGSPFK